MASNATSPSPSQRNRLELNETRLNATIMRLAFPAVLENLMYTFIFVADTLVVGHEYNENYLAASMVAGTLMFFINAPFQAMDIAATSLVARCWREQDFNGSRRLGGLWYFFKKGIWKRIHEEEKAQAKA